MLDIRTVLNGGRANHYNRLLGTVESLLQERIALKYGQSKHVVKDFQRLVNLLSATVLTRGSPEAPSDPLFLPLDVSLGKVVIPASKSLHYKIPDQSSICPGSREKMLSPTRACLLQCGAKQLRGS